MEVDSNPSFKSASFFCRSSCLQYPSQEKLISLKFGCYFILFFVSNAHWKSYHKHYIFHLFKCTCLPPYYLQFSSRTFIIHFTVNIYFAFPIVYNTRAIIQKSQTYEDNNYTRNIPPPGLCTQFKKMQHVNCTHIFMFIFDQPLYISYSCCNATCNIYFTFSVQSHPIRFHSI